MTNETASSSNRSVQLQAPISLQVARHESGKLRASWGAPDSGPTPTGYTVQWKESGDAWTNEEDVSNANTKKTEYVITELTDGTEYAVRVIAKNGGDASDPTAEVVATPQETVPPALQSAAVDGATLTITFDEALDAGQAPDKSHFAVTVAGSSRDVDTVSVSGSVVTLALVTSVFQGEPVTVGYTTPADDSAPRLQDLVGNAVSSFSRQGVTNNTAAAPQLTASTSEVPDSHDGSSTFTFELRLSEEPRDDFSYKYMRDHAFTITGGTVIKSNRLAPPSNVGWLIHITPGGDGEVTAVLPVVSDCTVHTAICTGDRRPLSSRLEIRVDGPGE